LTDHAGKGGRYVYFSKLELFMCYLYFIKEDKKRGSIKIGVSANLSKRLEMLQNGNPNQLVILMKYQAESRKHALLLEKWMHRKFTKQRLKGEWFNYKIDLKRAIGKLEKDPFADLV
jgi:predicted GIY-YIG superfamily endonuclease